MIERIAGMTTAAESHETQISAIKARKDALAAKFADPAVTRIDDDGLGLAAIMHAGLAVVYIDPLGRFWKVKVNDRNVVAEMVLDPHGPSRGREDFDLQGHMGLEFPHADQAKG